MSIMSPNTVRRITRPLSVWVLTVWNGLYAGVFPAVLAVFFYAGDNVIGEDRISLVGLLLYLALGLSIVVSAVLAWRGNNVGRIALLVLTTLHYGGVALNNALLALSGDLPDLQGRLWGNALRPTLMIIVNFLYFLSGSAKEFYRRPGEDDWSDSAE